MLEILNTELKKIFATYGYDEKYAYFQYSDRPDLSDFQTNAALVLAKTLKKNPMEIGESIASELSKADFFEKVSVDKPGFVNVVVKNELLLANLPTDDKLGYIHKEKPKMAIVEFSSPNVAKEMHVGHLRSTIIGESLQRIFKFAGDNVIADNHLGDWGTNMGMVIEAIRNKYPQTKCFQKGFDGDVIDDLNLKPDELLELYRYSNIRAKDDKDFYAEVQESTRLLQSGYKPYNVLWRYFWSVSMDDMNDIYRILDVHFDTYDGESIFEKMCEEMVVELKANGKAVMSEGALVVDLSELDMPPLLLVKGNGAFLYATTDLATIKHRVAKYDFDLTLYVVDYRQSLHFKQVFASAEKVDYLKEKNVVEHIAYGTMNGKDNKPFKTRSGDTVKLRDLINETVEVIGKKSSVQDADVIQKVAVACLKFADLINFRESSYIFDMEQFTNFEGKTGAYVLYSVVRINSILANTTLSPSPLAVESATPSPLVGEGWGGGLRTVSPSIDNEELIIDNYACDKQINKNETQNLLQEKNTERENKIQNLPQEQLSIINYQLSIEPTPHPTPTPTRGEGIRAVQPLDLTDDFENIRHKPKTEKYKMLNKTLHSLIGFKMKTEDNKIIEIQEAEIEHIEGKIAIDKKNRSPRSMSSVANLKEIIKNATYQKTAKIDSTHNNDKNIIELKNKLENHLIFNSKIRIGKGIFNVVLTTNKYKNDNSNINYLYEIYTKKTANSGNNSAQNSSNCIVDYNNSNVNTLSQNKNTIEFKSNSNSINSVITNNKKQNVNTPAILIRTKEERDLLMELTRFTEIFKITYEKRAPHFLAEYTYNLAKKFNAFYATSPINNEKDEQYKQSKIAILQLIKKYLETCLNLLSIATVEKM